MTHATGSTNPFRQSAFVNQNTGVGWQNSGQQGTHRRHLQRSCGDDANISEAWDGMKLRWEETVDQTMKRVGLPFFGSESIHKGFFNCGGQI